MRIWIAKCITSYCNQNIKKNWQIDTLCTARILMFIVKLRPLVYGNRLLQDLDIAPCLPTSQPSVVTRCRYSADVATKNLMLVPGLRKRVEIFIFLSENISKSASFILLPVRLMAWNRVSAGKKVLSRSNHDSALLIPLIFHVFLLQSPKT